MAEAHAPIFLLAGGHTMRRPYGPTGSRRRSAGPVWMRGLALAAVIFMAAAAFCHDIQLKAVLIGTADRMGGVAVIADRQRFIAFADEFRMDTLLKFLFDPVMAFAACGRQVLRIHAGGFIIARQNTMSRMTVRAHCRNGQSAFHQSLAVNAFRIMLNDFMLITGIADSRLLSFVWRA